MPNNGAAQLGLRMVPADGAMLDTSANFGKTAFEYQAVTAQQCFRFIDSEVHYRDNQLNLLLRALQVNDMKDRQVYIVMAYIVMASIVMAYIVMA